MVGGLAAEAGIIVCLLVLALAGWSVSLSLETVGVVPAGGLVVQLAPPSENAPTFAATLVSLPHHSSNKLWRLAVNGTHDGL